MPDKAARSREITIARFLKRNRIRRCDTAHVLEVLRRPLVQVAAGTIGSLAERPPRLDPCSCSNEKVKRRSEIFTAIVR
jgi:hypothetical protein